MSSIDVIQWVLLAGFGFTVTRAGLPPVGKTTDHVGAGIAGAGCAIGVGLLAIARTLS